MTQAIDAAVRSLLATVASRGMSIEERMLGARRDSDTPTEPSTEVFAWRDRLQRIGVWNERLAVLGAEETEAVRVLSSPNVIPPKDALRLERFLCKLLQYDTGEGVRQTRRYSPGLPPLPPAIERYVEDYVSTSVVQSHTILTELFDDLNALVVAETNSILAELHELLLPTLATELHVASTRGDLKRSGSEDRFAEYCETLLPYNSWLIEYLEAYPVAIRQLELIVSTRTEAFIEILERLSTDHERISALLLEASPSRLVSISDARGDRHRYGRCVRVLEFSNGQVVYKPRSVEADDAFLKLLMWCNSKSDHQELYILKTVAGEGYGWFEFVGGRDCSTPAEIARFYERHGAHIALLYLLGGYDFFHENVRAQGEYPVLIDLECVHAPVAPPFNANLFESTARQYLDESVHKTGLLPSWSWVYFGRDGVNMSALTETDGQMTPQDVVDWTGHGSDGLRQARTRVMMDNDPANLPTLNGTPIAVNDYMEHLFAGFRSTYLLIEQNNQQLAAPDGPLRGLGHAECRLVLRNTVDYHILLRELRHPRYMSSGFRFSELLDRLWASLCPRYSPGMIASEIKQLWRRDVPLFSSVGTSSDLLNDEHIVIQKEYLPETAQDAALRRLARWSSDDCERQADIMRAAFAITELPHVSETGEKEYLSSASLGTRRDVAAIPALDSAMMIREAVHLADGILDQAVEDDRALTWIGLGLNRAGQWDQSTLDASLYDGGPGIALFLMYLYQVTCDERYGSAYRKIVQFGCVDAAERVLQNRSKLENWVTYSPTGFLFPFSAAYLGIHAQRLDESFPLDIVTDAAIAWGSAALHKKPRYDFLNGAAGVIRVLLLAYRSTGNEEALTLATSYGQLLLDGAVRMDEGIAWYADQYSTPLTGFSHGTSGIAWVLADLAKETGLSQFMEAARSALVFDRTTFAADRGQWIDLRYSEAELGSSVQWCHGISGMGLGRVLLANYMDDPELIRDAEAAVGFILSAEDRSDCLCHGTLGNLECAMVAAEMTGNSQWHARINEKLGSVWTGAYTRGFWRTGIPGRSVGISGLFMGTSGIGYGLLRFARPDLVPSCLFLEEPKSSLAKWDAQTENTSMSVAGKI